MTILDFPLWLRATHFFNFLFLSLLVWSGLEILSAHPRLYWSDHCTPGSEWLKFTKKQRPKDQLWAASDEESSFPYQYEFNLADVAEVWRRGSVVASWLLDLTAIALFGQHDLARFSGRVSDSGEGRWTITAAIDEGAPAPVLSAALYQRFTSRGEEDFGDKLLSAMRFEFGGHVEKKS